MKKLWKVIAFYRPLAKPVNTFSAYDEPQALTASYLIREELGDIVLAPGYSNDEIVTRRLRELAELRGVKLELSFSKVTEASDGTVSVAIDSEIWIDDPHRDYSSICPFCDHEVSYKGTATKTTFSEQGMVDVEDPKKADVCEHFFSLDADPDVLVYNGSSLDLARPAVQENHSPDLEGSR